MLVLLNTAVQFLEKYMMGVIILEVLGLSSKNN